MSAWSARWKALARELYDDVAVMEVTASAGSAYAAHLERELLDARAETDLWRQRAFTADGRVSVLQARASAGRSKAAAS